MNRDTFIFYRSFKESMSNLSDSDKLMMYEAISDYSLDLKEPDLEGFPKSLFYLIRPILDANIQRWKNGLKGGAPTGNNNAKKTTEKQPENNRATTKKQANKDKDKDVNKDKDKEYKKEYAKAYKKESADSSLAPSPDFLKFQKWIKEHAPFCANEKNMQQITEKELAKLKAKYTGNEVADVIEKIENRKDLRKKYSSLYRTTLEWLKREHGIR